MPFAQHLLYSSTTVVLLTAQTLALVSTNSQLNFLHSAVNELPGNIQNSDCQNDLLFWLESLIAYFSSSVNNDGNKTATDRFGRNINNNFAIKQLDSFGKITPNLFGYSNQWIGSWDECLSVTAIDKPSYKTQFCYVSLVPPSPPDLKGKEGVDICTTKYFIKWSICMPKTCNNTDINAIFSVLNKKIPKNLFKFCSVQCKPTEGPQPSVGYWIILIFGCTSVTLVVIATYFDYYTTTSSTTNDKERLRQLSGAKYLLAFSMYTNASELLDTEIRPGHIHSIHALKVLSLTWVIYGHTYSLFIISDNLVDVFDAPKHRLAQGAFTGAFNAVDTFFFISGLLFAYIFFHHIKQNPSYINQPRFWFIIYAHRYFRLAPAYFIYLAFEINFHERLSLGALSLQFLNVDAENCRRYWWRNVLFINAMYAAEGECQGHTWYLASEIQLFLYAPLLLIPLFYSVTAGVATAGTATALFMIFNYIVYYKYNFPINHFGFNKQIFDADKVLQYELILYKPFWSHVVPYVIGVLTGYFLECVRGRKLHLNRLIVACMWLGTCCCTYAILFGLHNYYMDTEHGFSVFEKASYNFWCKIGWSAIIAWIIIACEHNWAGPVKTLLEWNFWIPFSRMCYAIYIVHVFVISMAAVKRGRQFHFINLGFMYLRTFSGVFLALIVLSFFYCCIVEWPFAKIEMLLFQLLGTKSEREKIKLARHKRRSVTEDGNDRKDVVENDCQQIPAICYYSTI